MKQLLATILVFSAISFLACDEDDKKIEALTGNGEISVIIVERETVQTPEKEFKSQGGMVTTAYAKEEKGNSFSVSKTVSFTALIKVPLQVKIEKEILSLIKLDIANTQGKLLYSLSGESLAALKKEAKFGLELTVVGTKDGSVPQEVRMNKKTTPPASAEPDKNYVPVSTVFSDPLDIVKLPDTENTLKKLREVATATEEYHRDLLKVVTDAPSLDMAHLNLLLDACYYPYALRQQMEEEYRKLWEKNDEETQKLREIVAQNISLADGLAQYTSQILNVGLPKVLDLTLEGAIELLQKLFPYGGGASEAFTTVIEKFSPLTSEKKLELLTLALQKNESTVALNLAIDWFQHDSNKSLAALVELSKYFSYDQKDRLLLSCYKFLPSLTTDELLKLIGLAYSKGKTLALNRVNEVSDFSIHNAVRVIKVFSYDDRDDMAEKVLSRGGSLTAAELRSVISSTYSRGEHLARNNCDRISNVVPADITALANIFSYDSKDNVLLTCSARLESMTTDELIGMINASYSRGVDLAKMHYTKLQDYSATNIARIANRFSYDAKDTVLLKCSDRLAPMTADELIAMINASYSKGVELTKMHYLKLVDFSAASVAKIANRFSYDSKDTVIAGALDTLTSVTSEDVKRLVSASYAKPGTFAAQLISKINDLTVVNAVSVAKSLSYDAKDTFLLKAVVAVTDPSGDNILSLAQSAYGQGMTVLMRVLERVKNLTVAQSITIARNLSYDNKDTFLLRAVDIVVDLSASNLMPLASQASSKKDQIIQKGLERLSQPK